MCEINESAINICRQPCLKSHICSADTIVRSTTPYITCRAPVLERMLHCSLEKAPSPKYKESEAHITGQISSSYPIVWMGEESGRNSVL